MQHVTLNQTKPPKAALSLLHITGILQVYVINQHVTFTHICFIAKNSFSKKKKSLSEWIIYYFTVKCSEVQQQRIGNTPVQVYLKFAGT